MKRTLVVALMSTVPATLLAAAANAASSNPDSWELRRSDLEPSGYARQQPNMTPSAPSQPVTDAPVQAAPGNWPVAAVPYKGYAFAGGTLTTGITTATIYDDNVFAGRTVRLSDVAFVARPEFTWAMQGAGYALNFDGYVEGRSYVNYQSENQINGSVGSNFTVTPNADTQVVGGARYIHAHLDRGTSETIAPGGLLLSTVFNKPIAYDQALGSIALNNRFDRWWTSLGLAGLGVKFDNAMIGDTLVDLSYANGGIGVANGRLGYVLAPQTSVFVEGAGNKRSWQVNAFDSVGYRVVGGVLFEQGPGARIKGEVWAGYMNQQYNGASFQTVSNWTYGAALAMQLTDRLTGVIEGKREAKEAALALAVIAPGVIGASNATCAVTPGAVCVSAIQSSISGRLDYKILPNVIVGAGASYVEDMYLGAGGGGRVDRTLSPLASAKYFPSDRVALGFDYRRVNFDPTGGETTGVGAISYYRNIYMLSMNGRF